MAAILLAGAVGAELESCLLLVLSFHSTRANTQKGNGENAQKLK
jgi:hypothetical protein